MTQRFLITGCSGGGKSSLLAALAARGCATIPEPGRRIVAEARARTGAALPWVDPAAFARRAVEMARADLATAPEGRVFFDRGLLDAAVALEHEAGVPMAETLGAFPYAAPVFLAPPWEEIFAGDADRRHGFAAAVAEYDRLSAALEALGVPVLVLPKGTVEERVGFVLGATEA